MDADRVGQMAREKSAGALTPMAWKVRGARDVTKYGVALNGAPQTAVTGWPRTFVRQTLGTA